MNNTAIILGIALLALSACKNQKNKEFLNGEGDMLYKIHHDESGPAVNEFDFLAVTTIEKTEEDSVIRNMYNFDNRSVVTFRDKAKFKGDLNTAYGMLSEGDSATFKINLDSMVAKEGITKSANTKGKYLIYTIKVNKVLLRGNKSDSLINAEIETYRRAEDEHARRTEAAKINKYLTSNKLKPNITPSGLNYIISRKGNGPNVKLGDTLFVKYTIKFLSGQVYYTTDSLLAKKTGTYVPGDMYGRMKVIPRAKNEVPYSGFEEATWMFPVGTKATLLLPSKLAYGAGDRGVPAYTPLSSEIEILEIKPPKGRMLTKTN